MPQSPFLPLTNSHLSTNTAGLSHSAIAYPTVVLAATALKLVLSAPVRTTPLSCPVPNSYLLARTVLQRLLLPIIHIPNPPLPRHDVAPPPPVSPHNRARPCVRGSSARARATLRGYCRYGAVIGAAEWTARPARISWPWRWLMQSVWRQGVWRSRRDGRWEGQGFITVL